MVIVNFTLTFTQMAFVWPLGGGNVYKTQSVAAMAA